MSRYRFAPGRFPALPIERTLTDFAKSELLVSEESLFAAFEVVLDADALWESPLISESATCCLSA